MAAVLLQVFDSTPLVYIEHDGLNLTSHPYSKALDFLALVLALALGSSFGSRSGSGSSSRI